jgi:hypothetical protein
MYWILNYALYFFIYTHTRNILKEVINIHLYGLTNVMSANTDRWQMATLLHSIFTYRYLVICDKVKEFLNFYLYKVELSSWCVVLHTAFEAFACTVTRFCQGPLWVLAHVLHKCCCHRQSHIFCCLEHVSLHSLKEVVISIVEIWKVGRLRKNSSTILSQIPL